MGLTDKNKKGSSKSKPNNEKALTRVPDGKKGGCIPFDVEELIMRVMNAPKGLNNDQLAIAIGVSSSKFFDLKASNKEFLEAVEFYFNISALEVLKSLTKMAVGYSYDEVVKELKENPKTKKMELTVTRVTKKHVPPNAQAAIFYLKNRMPEHFKDKIETVHSLGGNLENIHILIHGKEK